MQFSRIRTGRPSSASSLLGLLSLFSSLVILPDAVAAAEDSADSKAGTAGASAAAPDALAPIAVTSARLRDARIDLSPSVGTTVYAIDSQGLAALSQGSASSFDEVLLHLPGVSKDSKASGSLHVRDDHGNVQYRINGVQLPENLSGFGTSIDTRFVEHLDFLTGALPAQYGLRTAGVVEIQTREGKITPGGQLEVQTGDHHDLEPSAQAFGSAEDVTWYFSGSGLASAQGIENPQPGTTAIHDQTRQQRGFANLSWFVDDDTRLALMMGLYHGRFQIPDNPGQSAAFTLTGVSSATTGQSALASAQLNEVQLEDNRFLAASFQQTRGKLDFQVSVFHQYSALHYQPDPVGDLVFNGVAADILRSASSNGVQLDGAWKANPLHTIRAGLAYTAASTTSATVAQVFAVDGTGAQAGITPLALADTSSQNGQQESLYVQDEWRVLPTLTVNGGLRYDHTNAFVSEAQYSPRLNVAWHPDDATLVHAGFSRYFTPPPQELSSQRNIALFAGTSNAALTPYADPVRAERSSYVDIGVAHTLNDHLVLAVDTYLKEASNLLDEGQFGQALILSPYNYARARVHGLELSATFSTRQWAAYGNLAMQRALASDIVSGQAVFGGSELAYIASHPIYLDHDQRLTASAGSSVHLGSVLLSADVLAGSGLRRSAPGVPNGDHLPGYQVTNLGGSQTWALGKARELEARLSLLNLFDRSYLLRDGTGVGVGAPQYGLRRTVYLGLSLHL